MLVECQLSTQSQQILGRGEKCSLD